MTTHVITCGCDDSLELAARLMSQHDLGWLPVVRRKPLSELTVMLAMSPGIVATLVTGQLKDADG